MIIAMKKNINAISLLLRLIFPMCLALDARSAETEEGAVYVAGQDFTLEQALSQALEENAAAAGRRYWVVVSGPDVASVVKNGADTRLLNAIKRIHEQGGIIYVCRSDMQAHGIAASDLVPEAAPVQGFGGPSGAESPPMPPSDNPLPADLQHARLIWRTCANRDPADASGAR